MTETSVFEILSSLSRKEKAGLCCGDGFWNLKGFAHLGLPSIMLTDGPNGLRKQKTGDDNLGIMDSAPATCFPTASALASTWNPALLHRVGSAIARECRYEGVSVLLGPGVDIKRNPRGGRNFEYFSEDPLLSGQLACAWVAGVQSEGVGTSPKHYAVNNHEYCRMTVDAIVDERTLRELYLPAYEMLVQSVQPWTIMSSYNKLNGKYLSDDRAMLTEILRNEWGFNGVVVSDWGATNDRIESLRAGLNLEMPTTGDINIKAIESAIDAGQLTEEQLDGAIAPIIELILKAKPVLAEPVDCPHEENHRVARQAAEEAIVLLKNDGNLLPLDKRQKVAVIGALAADTRFQGSGSARVNPTRVEQPLLEIEALLEDPGSAVYAQGYPLTGDAEPGLVEEALAITKASDRVVLVLGLTSEYESEGFDRADIDLPGIQLALVEALAPVYDKLVVVLQNGAPVALPFRDKVPAIIEAYLGGQAGASALARVLFGDVTPSGKLAETFPLEVDDVPSQAWFPGGARQSQYREGLWVGYRYFSSVDTPVAFPFGHGLSYTRFDYSGLQVAGDNASTETPEFCVTVTFSIANSGERAGGETAQVYVGQEASGVPRPTKELKAFKKVYLQPGESARIELKLDRRAFAWWSPQTRNWTVESGRFFIYVGASVEDIRLQDSLNLEGNCPIVDPDPRLGAYFEPQPREFIDSAFAALLGRDIPEPLAVTPFHFNSSIAEVKHTFIGKLLYKMLLKMVGRHIGQASETELHMIGAIMSEMPLRNLVAQSGGRFRPGVMKVLIHLMNRNWRGLLRGDPVPYS